MHHFTFIGGFGLPFVANALKHVFVPGADYVMLAVAFLVEAILLHARSAPPLETSGHDWVVYGCISRWLHHLAP